MEDGGEFLALRTAWGRQLGQQWPQVGDTVLITSDWNGEKLYGSAAFLTLAAGERVLVTHRNREGLLYGTAEAGFDRSGWFGGKGCTASLEVTLPVPVGPLRGPSRVPEGPPEEEAILEGANGEAGPEVEAYISRHGIDGAAAQALRELDPEFQSQVIRSDLTNCRNPSAVLLTRIDRVKGTPATSALATYQPQPPALTGLTGLNSMRNQARSRSPPRKGGSGKAYPPEAVEEFIMTYNLDDKAAQALRELPPVHQGSIIEIELTNTRNPSAVVCSRIASLPTAPSSAAPDAVEAYIQEFGLDDKCASELRSITPYEQQQVIEARPSNARNPSAVVISRIQAVKQQQQLPNTVEEYLVRNGIDASVSSMVRALAPEAQRQIISSDLSNCRNPSAVLMSRVRSMDTQFVATPVTTPRAIPRVTSPAAFQAAGAADDSTEGFIMRNKIDMEAAQALLSLLPHQQREITQRGDLSNCRNPSKVLLSRIREIGGQV
mmetsp:Transcript_61046/g.181889  ORF Transcript_61046/g.181889 Transcript_61046/m.181889 type:complete len:492 (+) Transcript_61046:42-1517(+)